MDLGKRIAAARTAAGMTQQELADKLFVSRHLVSKWEQGLRRPDLETVDRIASALSVPSDSIISRRECVIHELQALIPKGAELEPERLSGLLSRFLREQPERDADIFIRKYYMLDPYADIALDKETGSARFLNTDCTFRFDGKVLTIDYNDMTLVYKKI